MRWKSFPNRPLRALGFASLALLFTAVTIAADVDSAATKPGALRVISYNVQFLPGPGRIANKRPKLEYRAEQLGKEMSKFDIVGLQETFDDAPREILLKQLKEIWGDDYHAVVHPRPDEKRFNGGLLIASPLPILDSHFTHFTHFSDPKDYGVTADGFAGKGVLHARIQRTKDGPKDDFVDVFVTHLEARADNIREFQYPEMSAFIKQWSDPAKPTIILGDMNTHGMIEDQKDANSQYARMMKSFAEARPTAKLLDVWPTLMGEAHGGTSQQESTEKGSRIDYVIVSNPPAPAKGIVPLSIHIDPYPNAQTKFLSDHSSVWMEFEIRNP